jgi:hypothetical protein
LPVSEPFVMKSIWSWNGLGHAGGGPEDAPLDDELDDELDAPLEDAVELGSTGVQGVDDVVAGNCRSTDPAQRLGPSAPQPETAFTWS